MGQVVFIIIFIILILGILGLFFIKAGLQLQFIRLQKKQKPGSLTDYFRFTFSDEKARQLRVDAFMMFPLLYPIVLDEKREELNEIKRKVKRIHIFIYLLLVVLMVLGIIADKVFPNMAA